MLLERCCIILGRAWVSSELHFKCPHRRAQAIRLAGLLWVHMHVLSFTIETWASKRITAMYEWSCKALTWSKPRYCTYSQPALSCDCQTNTIVQKVAVRATNVNLNRLCSRSLSRQPCSLAVTLHAHSHGLAEPDGMDIQPSWNIRMCFYLKFTISGQSKHRYIDTHTHAQRSHTSVGLAQA